MKGSIVEEGDPAPVGIGKVRVRMWRDDRIESLEQVPGECMMDLLKRLGIRIDGALVMRGGTPVPLDDPVLEGDDITVIDVQSGG